MILISAVVTSLIINIHLYVTNNQLRDELARIRTELPRLGVNNQSSAVRVILEHIIQHPNAQWNVMKVYVKSDGSVYIVGDNWELQRYIGGIDAPKDGKNHYCWLVLWHDPNPMSMHVIDIYIDKDTWEIIKVEEAW